jgi:uncharacterized phage protein (TIGR01671 family)
MREIKFRAWDRKKSKWMPQPFYMGSDGEKLWEDPENIDLMQFTGLYDKNGKEIYDGDIFKITQKPQEILSVIYGNGFWCFREHALWLNEFNLLGEVIGNIYENHELLEED